LHSRRHDTGAGLDSDCEQEKLEARKLLFSGECLIGEPQPFKEGLAEWIPFEWIGELPVVEDLPVLLGRIHAMRRGDPPFI
jgi:hypothetical protein